MAPLQLRETMAAATLPCVGSEIGAKLTRRNLSLAGFSEGMMRMMPTLVTYQVLLFCDSQRVQPRQISMVISSMLREEIKEEKPKVIFSQGLQSPRWFCLW